MKNSTGLIVTIIVGVILGFIIVHNNSSVPSIEIGGVKVNVDLATTPKTQAQGLSGRSSLAPDHGMLFVFDTPSVNYFWMKDMNFPIDMIWIDENMKVIYVQKNATPQSYPATFGPNEKTKYVLEIVSGFADTNHVNVGDRVSLSNI